MTRDMTCFMPQPRREFGPLALQTIDLGKKREMECILDWITGTNHVRNEYVLRAND